MDGPSGATRESPLNVSAIETSPPFLDPSLNQPNPPFWRRTRWYHHPRGVSRFICTHRFFMRYAKYCLSCALWFPNIASAMDQCWLVQKHKWSQNCWTYSIIPGEIWKKISSFVFKREKVLLTLGASIDIGSISENGIYRMSTIKQRRIVTCALDNKNILCTYRLCANSTVFIREKQSYYENNYEDKIFLLNSIYWKTIELANTPVDKCDTTNEKTTASCHLWWTPYWWDLRVQNKVRRSDGHEPQRFARLTDVSRYNGKWDLASFELRRGDWNSFVTDETNLSRLLSNPKL